VQEAVADRSVPPNLLLTGQGWFEPARARVSALSAVEGWTWVSVIICLMILACAWFFGRIMMGDTDSENAAAAVTTVFFVSNFLAWVSGTLLLLVLIGQPVGRVIMASPGQAALCMLLAPIESNRFSACLKARPSRQRLEKTRRERFSCPSLLKRASPSLSKNKREVKPNLLKRSVRARTQTAQPQEPPHTQKRPLRWLHGREWVV
jgi:hypothetical protein